MFDGFVEETMLRGWPKLKFSAGSGRGIQCLAGAMQYCCVAWYPGLIEEALLDNGQGEVRTYLVVLGRF